MNPDPTREKILKVASRIFGKYGLQKTTMDEIARTAHKAKGSLYYYFSSKEDLFMAVVSDEIEVLKSALVAVSEKKGETAQIIKDYMITRMKVLNDAVNYHQALKADFTETYEFLDDLRAELDEFEVNLLSKIFQKGVNEKTFEIRDVRKTAQVIIMMFKAMEIPFYLQDKISEYEDTIVELLNILLRGLGRGAKI